MRPGIARAGFAALILLALAAILRSTPPPSRREMLDRAVPVLRAAGYRVAPSYRRILGNGELGTGYLLSARHPACSGDVTLRAIAPGTTLDAPQPGTQTVFGMRAARTLSTAATFAEIARLHLWHTLHRGRGAPAVLLLVVQDPSACLLIAEPDWPAIWYR